MGRGTLKDVMLVEDDPDIQEVVKLALCSVGGFNVEVCSSGQEALTRVVEVKPQIILLDMMMPGMDGITTLKKLRENPKLSETPIIFLTAKVQPLEVERYKQLGAADVIAKPFDPMTLSESVVDIWNRTE